MPCYSSENDILAFHTHKFSRYLHHDPCSAILNEEMSILNEDMSKVLGALFYVVKQKGPDLSWFFYENSLLWLRGYLHRLHGDKCSNLILQFPYSPIVARSHLVLSLKGRLLSYSKSPSSSCCFILWQVGNHNLSLENLGFLHETLIEGKSQSDTIINGSRFYSQLGNLHTHCTLDHAYRQSCWMWHSRTVTIAPQASL